MPLTISCLLSYYSPMLLQNPNRFIKVSTHSAIRSYFTLIAVVFLIGVSTQIEAANLQTIEGCKLVDANWSDGDSFPIVTPNHKKFTVRQNFCDIFVCSQIIEFVSNNYYPIKKIIFNLVNQDTL